jgi:hypothetical protein
MNAVADLKEGLTMEAALPEPFTGLRIGLFEGPWLMEGFHPPPSSCIRFAADAEEAKRPTVQLAAPAMGGRRHAK